ncbi:MAG TPA: TetR/AcrR family transcriptional regulator C-terminal domain-containing protein, partial [Pseudonocardiaceae bacterium]|nr:TetR/AcrR family transcriptional regulator C-terminal domain-containing protein [Pseudonocardiaceae bacterium]
LISRQTVAAIGPHPWALVSLRYAAMGPNAMLHFEQSLHALRELDADFPTKIEIMAIIDDYVHGYLLRSEEVRARTETPTDDDVDAAVEFAKAQLAAGDFPLTRELYEQTQRGEGWQHVFTEEATARRFDRGLQALLDGLAVRYDLPR